MQYKLGLNLKIRHGAIVENIANILHNCTVLDFQVKSSLIDNN